MIAKIRYNSYALNAVLQKYFISKLHIDCLHATISLNYFYFCLMPDNIKPIITNPLKKNVALVTLVVFGLLLIASCIYFKERILFIDAPHQLFRMINDGEWQILDSRYGSMLSQAFPFYGAKMHLPLRWLMILYSSGFYIFYLLVAMLLVFRYKNYGLALLFALYLTLFVSEAFYCTTTEGFGLLFLAYGSSFHVADRYKSNVPLVAVFVLSFALAMWTHPLVILVAVNLWFFFWLRGEEWPFTKVQSWILSIILLALAVAKIQQGSNHGYDSSKIEVVTNFQPGKILELYKSPQFKFFMHGCMNNYWLFVLIFLAGLAALAYQKKYLLFLLTLFSTVGYCVLVVITFWDIHSNRFYIESEYMPVTIISSAPFVYYILPRLNKKMALWLVIAIFSIRGIYIINAAPVFTHRVEMVGSILGKMKEKGITKLIIPGPVAEVDKVMLMNWALPTESIVLSSLNGDQPQLTFVFGDTHEIKSLVNTGKDTMIGCWERRPISKFNTFYYMPDTNRQYQVMSFEDVMR